MRGYRNALAEHRIAVPESYVVLRERFEETGDLAGYQAMQELLRLDPRPDAVFCYNDLTAAGAIEATLKAGLSVPEDIAFIGCGNFRYADYLRIPLSSVDQSTAQLGRIAGEASPSNSPPIPNNPAKNRAAGTPVGGPPIHRRPLEGTERPLS